MLRKFLESFTATHFTVLALSAMFVPTALYAVTSTYVSIMDPITGARSLVDQSRRIWVFDPLAAYRNNPANYVQISGMSCQQDNTLYTPPAGKALIVTAVNFFHFSAPTGGDNFNYIKDGAAYVAASEDGNANGSLSVDLGNGYVVKSGHPVTALCSLNGSYFAAVIGYLVPSAAVPAAGTAEAAAQSVIVGAPMVKDGKRF